MMHRPSHHQRSPVSSMPKIGLFEVQGITIDLKGIESRKKIDPSGQGNQIEYHGDHPIGIRIPLVQKLPCPHQTRDEVPQPLLQLHGDPEHSVVLWFVIKLISKKCRMVANRHHPLALAFDRICILIHDRLNQSSHLD